MRNSKLLFLFIPKSYWIGLLCGLLVRLPGGEYIIISNITINIIIVLIFIKLGVILHEIGHLSFARLAGGKPRRMVIGKGNELLRFEFLKTKIIVNTSVQSGFAYATFESSAYLKLKYLVYTSGGPLTNLGLALLGSILFGFHTDLTSGKFGIDIAFGFILSNIILSILSLVPLQMNYSGLKIQNDGLKILNLPFKKTNQIQANLKANELLDAYEYFEIKEYDKAIQIYEKYLELDDTRIMVKIDLSILYLKKGQIDKSLRLLCSLESSLSNKENKPYIGMISNNLAWLYLIKQDIENADKYSEIAMDINPREKNFQGTRGSVLIEKGELDQGINQLIDLADTKYANSQSLSAAMYLGLAYAQLGNEKKYKKYVDFVTGNISHLDHDERMIWDHVKKRLDKPAENSQV